MFYFIFCSNDYDDICDRRWHFKCQSNFQPPPWMLPIIFCTVNVNVIWFYLPAKTELEVGVRPKNQWVDQSNWNCKIDWIIKKIAVMVVCLFFFFMFFLCFCFCCFFLGGGRSVFVWLPASFTMECNCKGEGEGGCVVWLALPPLIVMVTYLKYFGSDFPNNFLVTKIPWLSSTSNDQWKKCVSIIISLLSGIYWKQIKTKRLCFYKK